MGNPEEALAGAKYRKHAMAEWKARKAAREMQWAMEEGARATLQMVSVNRCTFCNGNGWIYSGDLTKPVGHGRECPNCVGGYPKAMGA